MITYFSKWIRPLNIHLPWLLVMILISVQSHISGDKLGSSLASSDKISHFIIFGLLGWLLVRAVFKQKNTFIQQNYFWIVLIIVAIFAIIDEIHQYYIPGRYFEMLDWVADTSGATLFLLIYKFRNKI